MIDEAKLAKLNKRYRDAYKYGYDIPTSREYLKDIVDALDMVQTLQAEYRILRETFDGPVKTMCPDCTGMDAV